jgi:hypothetical protein
MIPDRLELLASGEAIAGPGSDQQAIFQRPAHARSLGKAVQQFRHSHVDSWGSTADTQ